MANRHANTSVLTEEGLSQPLDLSTVPYYFPGVQLYEECRNINGQGSKQGPCGVGQPPLSFSLAQCGLGKRHGRDCLTQRSASMLLVSNTAQSCVHVHVCRCVQVHRVRVEARGQHQASFQPLSTSFRVTGSLTEPRACWFG